MVWIIQRLIQAGLLLWIQANALFTPPSSAIMAKDLPLLECVLVLGWRD